MFAGKKRANELDGRTWTRYSISVWNDLHKNSAERKLSHPAFFPLALVERILQIFSLPGETVLDPFMGSGSTLLGALRLGRRGVGFEINDSYIRMFKERLQEIQKGSCDMNYVSACGTMVDRFVVFKDDARNLERHLEPLSLDLCLTSPPYWDILNARRTADHKPVRNYGDLASDLGNIEDYSLFLKELQKVFGGVYRALKMGKYCIVVVMDIRKKNIYYPLHIDLSNLLVGLGFVLDDIIIWDRRDEYNNLRPLGYPHVFRVNKIHEYILIMQKRPGL